MAKLTIALDKKGATYEVGEPITGRVLVENDGDCTCKGLTVTLGWRTSGHGNDRTNLSGSADLYTGAWRADERASYRFSFAGVRGPLTYHGSVMSVDWSVRATADVPWAVDPKAEADLVLVRGKTAPEEVDQGAVYVPKINVFRREVGDTLGATFAGACFGPLGVLLVLGGLGQLANGQRGTGLGTLASGGLCLLVVGAAALKHRGAPGEKERFGEATAWVDPRTLAPGGAVKVTFRSKPGVDVQLGKVTASLVCREVVVRGGGKQLRTIRKELHRASKELGHEERVPGGGELVLQETLALPDDAPPSLDLPDHELTWSVDLHVEMRGWPDWDEDVPLLVRPA